MEHTDPGDQTTLAQYHHVSVWKFVLLSICTFGIYELYWFYKCWIYVQQRDQEDIWPFWRAFFSNLWFFFMARDIADNSPVKRSSVTLGVLAYLYLVLNVAAWKLSDPYWMIGFFTVFLMIPVVLDVNSINRSKGVRADTYHRFSLKHIAVAAIGLSAFAITVFSSLAVIPRQAVTPGEQLPARVVSMLEERGLLNTNEKVIYFYSTAMFSYADDGNYFTDNRVVSYWREDGLYFEEQAWYQEIDDIQVEYSTSFLYDTLVTIFRKDGTSFLLIVSGEEKKDRDFVNMLKRTWRSYDGVL